MMRDIRPTPQSPKRKLPPMPLPDESELSKPPAAKQRRVFTGSKVPVSNVHVPRQLTAAEHAKDVAEKTPPVKKQTESRPLFVEPKKPPVPKRAPMRIGQKERIVVAVLFALIVIAGALAGFIFLPKANIALTLQTAPLLVDEKLNISANSNSTNHVPGVSFFREVTVSGTSPVLSTEIVGTKATGTAEIVNRTTEEQKIVENSRLVTKDGQLFFMKKHAIVPAASGSSISRVTVPIEADKAGLEGNIAPQTLSFAALDESSQSLVYAEVTSALTGGSGEEINVVKEEDIENARLGAQTQAKNQTEQEIRQELPKGWVVLEESWDVVLPEFTPSASAGDKISEISYTGKATVRVMGYEEQVLKNKLEDALKSRLDKDFGLFPGPISFAKSVNEINWENSEALITVRVTHSTIPNVSLETLQDKLSGRKKQEAISYLEGLKGVKQVSVETWPFWVTTIPRIEQRVDIDIKSDREP